MLQCFTSLRNIVKLSTDSFSFAINLPKLCALKSREINVLVYLTEAAVQRCS